MSVEVMITPKSRSGEVIPIITLFRLASLKQTVTCIFNINMILDKSRVTVI